MHKKTIHAVLLAASTFFLLTDAFGQRLARELVSPASASGLAKSGPPQPVPPFLAASERLRAVDIDRSVLASVGREIASSAGAPALLQVSFFPDATLTLEITRTEKTYSGGTAYTGRISGQPASVVVLVDNDGTASMHATSGTTTYSIHGSPDRGYLASQKSDAAERPDHPPTTLDLTGGQLMSIPRVAAQAQGDAIRGAAPVATADSDNMMDIMVMFTPAARTANGTANLMMANIDAQIALTNTINMGSNVVQRLRLVYRGETPYTEVNMDTDLPRVADPGDGFMDEIPMLRNLYQADFVSLWGVYSDYCGLGYYMGNENLSFASIAYNVVASPACTASNSYTFAHELGHNMGLQHDNFVTSTSPNSTVTDEFTSASTVIAYAHGYIDLTNRFRTVMSYNDQCAASGFNCTRIPFFSNPAISFNNIGGYAGAILATTGNAANAHEMRALNHTRETTQNFRTALLSFTGPGIVTFTPLAYKVAEAGGTVTLTVGRHVGSNGAISVNYATANGTATAGADYTTTSGTLNWAAGETANKTIVVPILQDTDLEGNHSFTVTLATPTGGASIGSSGGTTQSATVRITDDEPDTFPVGVTLPAGYTSPDVPGPNTPTTVWTVDLTQGFNSTASLQSARVFAPVQGTFKNSDLEYTGTFTAGNVTFAYKLSGYQSGFSGFEFQVDGVAQFNNATGGEVDWTPLSVPITAGAHTLRWRFKNKLDFPCANVGGTPAQGGAACADRAWVDSIVLPMGPVATTTMLGGTPNPSNTGQAVTFTAVVNTAGGPASGSTVNFRDGASSIAGCAAVALTGNSAQCVTSSLPNGTRSITAVYAGNASFAGSTSNAVSQVVNSVKSVNDLNGDGKSDLIFQDAGGNIAAWTMNGTGVINAVGLLPAGAGWSVTHAADFDGDGKADILLRHTDGRVLMWLMNGVAVSTQILLQPAASGWTVTHVGDMNGDGKADIQWENTAGVVAAWTMNGGTLTGATVLQPAASGWHITHMADLNGDGKADILWRHTDGTTVAWLMDGLTYLSSAGFTPAGSGWSITSTGDVNGDGKADLVFTKSDGAIMLWVMNGTGLISFAALQNAGTPWRITLVGDLDGDGKADLVWRNTDGSTYVSLMNGTATLSAGFLFGAASGWTATHLVDLNGDGKKDVLWRFSDGTLATWLMNGLTPIGAAGLIGPSTWQFVPTQLAP